MSAPDESTGAIRAMLREKTTTGAMPFFDQLIWGTKLAVDPPLSTLNTRLRIGIDPGDEQIVWAYHITCTSPNQHHAIYEDKHLVFYKEGHPEELLHSDLKSLTLDSPFHRLINYKFHQTSAYARACFILQGVTQEISCGLGQSFLQTLRQVVEALSRDIISSGTTISNTASKVSKSPPKDRLACRRTVSSSSSSQASEDNTFDMDEEDLVANRVRGKIQRASNIASINHSGHFTPANTQESLRSRSKRIKERLNYALNIPKHKSLGMFDQSNKPKRMQTEFGNRRGKAMGESIQERARTPVEDVTLIGDDESLFIPEKSSNERFASVSLQTAAEELDEQISTGREPSPGSSRLHGSEQRDDNDLLLLRSPGIEVPQLRETGECSMERQAREYLDLESEIEEGIIHIKTGTVEKNRLKEEMNILEKKLQDLDAEGEAVKNQHLEKAEKLKADVRERMEAELASIDTEYQNATQKRTESILEERKMVLKPMVKVKAKMEQEAARIRNYERVVAENEESLKALKQAGGFDLGCLVTKKKRKRKMQQD